MRHLTLVTILFSFALCLLAQQHPTGVLEPTPERRQWIKENAEEWQPRHQTRGPLPSRVINDAHLPHVFSQGELGICGSFAPTYYVRNYYESKAKGEGRWHPEDPEDRKKLISPMWTVLVSKHGDYGTYGPHGGYMYEACETLCNHGYLTLDELDFIGTTPENGYRFPSAEMQYKALRRKSGVPVVLSDINSEQGFQRLKQALAEGDIFAVSCTNLPENFDGFPNNAETVYVNGQPIKSNNHGVFAWPNYTGYFREGHAFTVIGYDDDIEYTNKEGETCYGALRIVNSWGTNWADGGYLWISYETVVKYHWICDTGYTFRDVTGEENYTPARTAVVTFSDEDNPTETGWQQMIGNDSRFWPNGFDFKVNGVKVDNLAPPQPYLIGMEKDNNRVEILLNLDGMENLQLLQYDLHTGFTGISGDHILGKLVSIETRDADLQVTVRDEPNDTVKCLDFDPTYEYWSSTLREVPGALPELWPHTGGYAMADFNGDGRMDAAACLRQYSEAAQYLVERRTAIFLQNADGSWTEKTLPIPASPWGVVPANLIPVDLDQDGDMDLAACDGNYAYFLQNDGQGNFTSLATLDFGENGASYCHFAMADFDNDGRPDFTVLCAESHLVIRQESPTQYTVYPVSKQRTRYVGNDRVTHPLAVGDLNGDGWMDIVTSGDKVPVLHINNGDLTFTSYTLPLPQNRSVAMAVADADQDGCDDLLYDVNTLVKGRPNDASGNVQMPTSMLVDTTFPELRGGSVAWADLDGDGRLEILVSGTTYNFIEGNGMSVFYGEGDVGKYYLHQLYRTYFQVLKWNEDRYTDAGLKLPGTVGFNGGSILDLVDMDGDGRLDIVHGGVFSSRWVVFTHGGPNHTVTGMKYLHNDIPFTNQNPTAPTNLQAAVKGNGKVTLTWTAGTDAETATGGLRYLVRIGTAAGKDDVVKGDPHFPRKSGVTLTHLPAQKLYCAVRTIDATGNLSPWSAEITFTSKGTTATPVPVDKDSLPEIEGHKIPENIVAASADDEMGQAHYSSLSYYAPLFRFYAYPNDGYRFAYWEGPVEEPLNCTSGAALYQDTTITAHFLPDDTRLQTSANATGYLDLEGNLWMYGNYNNTLGPVAQATPPNICAQSNISFFTLANDTAYFNRRGTTWYSWGDYSWYKYAYHHYPSSGFNQLLRALDGDLWYKLSNGSSFMLGTEHVEHAWGGPGGLAILTRDVVLYNATITRLFCLRNQEGVDNPAKFNVPDLEDVIDCKFQENFLIYLTSQGTLRGVGDNSYGQLGRATPATLDNYANITGLPCIVAITTGKTFCAALDKDGQVWTWGDNSCGQLGRQGGSRLPTPAKIAGLDHIVAIAAGDSHLLALDADGRLYGWGDNAQGQLGGVTALAGQKVIAIAAAVNHSCALTAEKKLYQWGDGTAAPQLLDDLSFEAAPFSLGVDEACAGLISMPAGSYVCRPGQEITLTAASDDEHFFQYWVVNDEVIPANTLKYTPTGAFSVRAIYASKPPVLTFGEPEIDENTITIPIRMSEVTSIYDGLDFTLQASAELTLSNIIFHYPYPTYSMHTTTDATTDGMAAYRFLAFGGNNLFDCENNTSVELCSVVFQRRSCPAMQANFQLIATPYLSRSRGIYCDAGTYGEPDTLVIPLEAWQNDQEYEGRTMSTSSFKAGLWNSFLVPGYTDATTPQELAQQLGVTDLTAWLWENGHFRQTDALPPNQPLLLHFTGTPAKSLEYYPEAAPPLELAPGWNLVMVQAETPTPAEATSVFRIDQRTHSNVRHEGPLAPGEIYWLFKHNQ